MEEAGLSKEDYARVDITMAIGVLGNIIPTYFWMMFLIFSTPNLLQPLRAELMPLVARNTQNPHPTCELDVADLREKAPLLLSCFQEVMRKRSTTAIVRFVKEDAMLADKYMLKKGSIIQMPTVTIHQQQSVWGDKAVNVEPDRFVAFQNGDAKISPSAYRAFGGGDHICPGRYFAAAETLSMVAIMVLAFDIEPKNGEWVEPPLNEAMFSSALLPPKGEVPVRLRKRAEFAEYEWRLNLTNSKGRFKLASG